MDREGNNIEVVCYARTVGPQGRARGAGAEAAHAACLLVRSVPAPVPSPGGT